MNTRLNGHETDTTNELWKALAEHLNSPRQWYQNLKLYILKTKLNTPRDVKYTESFIIPDCDMLKPLGINISGGKLASVKRSNPKINLWRLLSFRVFSPHTSFSFFFMLRRRAIRRNVFSGLGKEVNPLWRGACHPVSCFLAQPQLICFKPSLYSSRSFVCHFSLLGLAPLLRSQFDVDSLACYCGFFVNS